MSETHFGTGQPIHFRTAVAFLSDTYEAGQVISSQAVPHSLHQKLLARQIIKYSLDPHARIFIPILQHLQCS